MILLCDYVSYRIISHKTGIMKNRIFSAMLLVAGALTVQAAETTDAGCNRETVTVGATSNSGMMDCFITGEKGQNWGYEIHTPANSTASLDKIGLCISNGNEVATSLRLSVNVYDMSGFKGDKTTDAFKCVLDTPVTLDSHAASAVDGKLVYTLPDSIVLPADAVVEITIVSDDSNAKLWYDCNIMGESTWTHVADGDSTVWMKTPFASPFFVQYTVTAQ